MIPITIFTPTYNRAEFLARVNDSLCSQSSLGFEWLIVDDGSTDDTAERVRDWQRSAPFSIRYVYQPNRGKHCAHNSAIRQAAGELFAVLDSDDTLAPTAIERLLFHWNSIPEAIRPRFSGVSGLCTDAAGRIVGRPFPMAVLDCPHYDLEVVLGITGEKWGCHRTTTLRRFPFPEIPGEKYCPEGLVWNRIAHDHLVRHVNEPLRVYHRHSGSLTILPVRTLAGSPRGARLFYSECLELPAPALWKSKKAINYFRYSLHAGVGLRRAVREAPLPRLAAWMAPAGLLCYIGDTLFRRSPAESVRIPHVVPDRGGAL